MYFPLFQFNLYVINLGQIYHTPFHSTANHFKFRKFAKLVGDSAYKALKSHVTRFYLVLIPWIASCLTLHVRSVCNILQIHYERWASARKLYRVTHGQACWICTRNIPVAKCISMQPFAIKVKNSLSQSVRKIPQSLCTGRWTRWLTPVVVRQRFVRFARIGKLDYRFHALTRITEPFTWTAANICRNCGYVSPAGNDLRRCRKDFTFAETLYRRFILRSFTITNLIVHALTASSN